MNENDIRNFINSSSLGVYTKYIKIIDGHRYLVKSGRGDGKSKSLNLDFDYEKVVRKYSNYFSEKRLEFILELLKTRVEEVKICLSQNQK